MMTKLINLYYRGIVRLAIGCFKLAIKIAPTWRSKMDICDDIESVADELLSSHWKEARRAGAKILDVIIDVHSEFVEEFDEMKSIYYGDEEAA